MIQYFHLLLKLKVPLARNKNQDLWKHLQRDEICTSRICCWLHLDNVTIGTKLEYNCIVREDCISLEHANFSFGGV